MTETVQGALTIDRDKGTVWFNTKVFGRCLLRVQNIPEEKMSGDMIDLRM